MILRRVIEHVRAQDWFAVALDFLIVVLGVFIGMQVQEWNTARGERRLERAYLERLLADVELSIETTENIRDFLVSYTDNYDVILRATRGCSLGDDEKDAFADGLSDFGKVGPSIYALTTMDEMLSAGHFSLIGSREIRDILNGLKRDAQYQAEIRTALYAHIEGLTVLTTSKAILLYEDERSPFKPVKWGEVDVDFAPLCKDREFQAAVSHIRAKTINMINLNDRALEKLRPARQALERELSGAKGPRP